MQLFKKGYGSDTTALIILNEKMEDSIKIVKSLEQFRLLIKVFSEAIKNEVKQLEGGFLKMLLATLAAIILGNALRGVIRASE